MTTITKAKALKTSYQINKMIYCIYKYIINSNEIPMEIQNDDALKETYYKSEILLERVAFNVNLICKIITNKILIRKLYTFLLIKKFSDNKHIKLIQSEIFFFKIFATLKNLFRLYRKNEKSLKFKIFTKWKNCYQNAKKITEFKGKIENLVEKQSEEEITKLTMKLNVLEKEINDISKNLTHFQSKDGELKKQIKQFEERERKLNEKIKTLEDKKCKNKEILSSKIEKNTSSSLTEFSKLESKVKELENQYAKLKKDNKEKKTIINTFYNEMNEILLKHEQKVENMLQEEAINKHTSPKSNNANLICFTTGSLGNKKPTSSQRNNISKPKSNNYNK